MANGKSQAMPHQTRPPNRQKTKALSSFTPSTTVTPPWAGGSASAGNPYIKRNYSQIVAEAQSVNQTSTLIQFKLTKISSGDDKPQSLTYSQLGEFLFEQLKIDPNSCLGIDLTTGRYDTRELLLKKGTDTSAILTSTPHTFKGHEIRATLLSTQVTKVTFKHVPLTVPDEEILHLCCHYGELVDGIVHRDPITIGGTNRYTLASSTRWVEVNLTPGKTFHNYYWLGGPLPGDVGRRVTVLHQNQPRQCSWCFKYAPTSTSSNPNVCKGGGDGKTCKTQGTPRAKMSAYIDYLKTEGYTSLKDQHFAPQVAFPSLQGGKNSTNADVDEADHISEEESMEDFDNGDLSDIPAKKGPIEAKPETSSTEGEVDQEETPPEGDEKPPEEGNSSSSATSKPAQKSPFRKPPQQMGKSEKELTRYVRGDKELKDIPEHMQKYAQYAISQEYVEIDPKNPKNATLTPLGHEKFLREPKNSVNAVTTKRVKYDDLHSKIMALIKDQLCQPGGSKKEKARLHSESSPDGKESQSKSQRTGPSAEK